MTSKPDSVSTLGYHWTDRTGRPLEPQVHWDAIGTTLADACTHWCSSGDPVLICIIGTHWKTTGKPLEDHWKHTGISQVAFQCTLGSKFQAHWIATGLPLEDHWLRVRVVRLIWNCLWWMAQDLTYVYQHWFSYSAVRYFAFPSRYLVYHIVIVNCGIKIRPIKPE